MSDPQTLRSRHSVDVAVRDAVDDRV